MNYFGFIFVLVLLSLQIKATSFDLLKCDQYTIDDGLPQSFVENFFQDKKGFLWISTQDGLSRFNGYEFENFYSNPFDSTTILSNYIIGMSNWNQDSICFTTRIGISIFDPLSKKFKNFPFALNNDTVGSITSSVFLPTNAIIVSSSKGLFEIKILNNKSVIRSLNFQKKIKRLISCDNRIFFASDNTLHEITKTSVLAAKQFPKNIKGIFSTENGIGISFENQFIHLNKKNIEEKTFSIPASVNDCILSDGRYWLATQENGLVIYTPNSEKPFNRSLNQKRKNSLVSKKIKCIFKDSFGIIWIGTDSGINKIDPSKQQLLHYKASQHSPHSSNNTWSFWENDSLFLSGYDNGLQILKKSNKTHYWIPFKGLILDITNFNDTILLGTSKGVYSLTQKDTAYSMDSLFLDVSYSGNQDVIFKFLKTKNKLLIGSLNYLSLYDENLTLKNRWKLKNVRDFTELNNTVYFIAHPTSIYQLINLENNAEIVTTPLNEVEHLLGLSIEKSEGNNIWLGFYGGGVIKYNIRNKSSEHYSTKNGLPNNTIYSIISTENSIWFSTNGGLSKYNIKTKEFENYTASDGIQSLEFNSGSAYVNNKNQIYFGGINGYNIVNTNKQNINSVPPKVYISSIMYDGQDLLSSNSKKISTENNSRIVTIPHKKNNFQIIVDVLHYSSPNENLFKTKLDGWQKDWQTVKGKRVYKFSNLNYGEYNFLVKSANSDGIWNPKEEKITIIIKPPFYLTWWFISGISAFILGFIAITIKSRINRSKIQREILEKKVRDRTREVENQKKKLEEKNKELEEEKNKEEEVLLNVLPRETAKELVSTGKSTPKSYKMATVMFADFKNFTKITENLGPKELVAELDDSFAKFDDIVGALNIEKIKTSGDAYMCVGGIPIRNQTNPVDCVLAAFQFQKYMFQKREIREGTGKPQWHLRVGLHTGALVAGVVGKKKFLYDVWGDTVNTAARMETSAEEGMINVSGATYEHIKDYFECEYRGKLPVKNKGAIDMFYVTRIKTGLCKDENGQTPNRKFFELLNFKVYTQQSFQNVRDYFIDLLEQNEFVSKLKYHGPHHTVDVMNSAERIGLAEGIGKEELMLVKLAALFHDSGFLNKYQDNEFEGAKLAKRELPRYGFTDGQVEVVVNMILATKIPQDPKNHLEEILCDADLDYLGRDKNEFERISSSLAQELIDMKIIKSMEDWDPIQVKFLESHQYYTKTCIESRRPNKIQRLREIKNRLTGPNQE
ncbi:MAG: hypothetical protein CMP63_03715 [Flavobacteriales bacterium]|nr:hypothetical protein [Flavobacteriales bacterium]|tara:strand:- start:5133 stop:8852 length:3720 start_codon:yes stop_codon:yes gene_type:complete